MSELIVSSGRDTHIGEVIFGDKITSYAAPLALSLHQLPPPPPDFTGREAELKELLADVEKGGVTISGLHGLGGVGKTALALKLAEHLAPRYPDAQFYLDLKGAHEQKPLTPAEALAHVVRAYYPEQKLPDDETQLRGLYHSVLNDKRALILLDNARDAAQVAPLLPPSSCIAIITSRQHFAMSGLRSVNLDELPPGDAKDLIRRIVTRLSEEELAGALDEMARLCSSLPLALRASASALQERVNLSPADYVRRLRDENGRLQLEGLKAEGVPISVAASFNLSYQLLTEEQRTLWRTLAVFPDSFDRAAAAAVWELEEDPAQDALGELVRYSLLDFTPTPPLPRSQKARTGEGEALPSPVGVAKHPDGGPPITGGRWAGGGGGRYRLHDLARLFAHSRLSQAERYSAQSRHAAHYERVLRLANRLYEKDGDSIKQGLNLFDLEWTNIQAGQAWADVNTEKDKRAARLCGDYPNAGVFVLSLRQHPRERIHWLEAGLATTRTLIDRLTEGVHLGNLGHAYAALGDARTAIAFHEQALALARETGDRRNEGNALGNLGNAHRALGDARAAIAYHQQHLILARETYDRRGEGNALGNLGDTHFALGKARTAIEFYEQALALAHEIGDWRGEGNALGSLGNAHADLGDAQKAIAYYEQALALAHEIGDRRGKGNALDGLGLAHAALGDALKAIAYHEQALVICREIGNRRGEGHLLGNIGNAYADLGDARKAIEFYEQGLIIDREIGDRRGEGADLFNMSLAFDTLGDRRQAIAHAKAALKIYEQIESPYAERLRKKLAEWGV